MAGTEDEQHDGCLLRCLRARAACYNRACFGATGRDHRPVLNGNQAFVRCCKRKTGWAT